MQIIPFSQPSYISVYRLLFCLKILRCLCVVTSWFATITFPVSAYIASLCARTSMLVDPQHQYIVFLNQFLKGGFYTGKKSSTSYRRNHLQQQKEVSTHAEEKFLFHSLPCLYAYYPNSSAGVFRCLCKERFLHRKNQLSHSPPMFARQCSPAIAKARYPPCTICSRTRQYTEKTLKTEILPRQKRGFYMLILADWAVAISSYSLLNLLHLVWKSLSPSVFSSLLACGNLSFYIL